MSQPRPDGFGGEASADERYVVVSTDSHVGPSVKGQLRQYCESRHLDDFDRFVAEMESHGLPRGGRPRHPRRVPRRPGLSGSRRPSDSPRWPVSPTPIRLTSASFSGATSTACFRDCRTTPLESPTWIGLASLLP